MTGLLGPHCGRSEHTLRQLGLVVCARLPDCNMQHTHCPTLSFPTESWWRPVLQSTTLGMFFPWSGWQLPLPGTRRTHRLHPLEMLTRYYPSGIHESSNLLLRRTYCFSRLVASCVALIKESLLHAFICTRSSGKDIASYAWLVWPTDEGALTSAICH